MTKRWTTATLCWEGPRIVDFHRPLDSAPSVRRLGARGSSLVGRVACPKSSTQRFFSPFLIIVLCVPCTYTFSTEMYSTENSKKKVYVHDRSSWITLTRDFPRHALGVWATI